MAAPRDFHRVPTRALAAFGASGFAQNVVGTCLGVHLFIFYTDAVGLAPLWISAALFVATLWDAAFGIVMGQISDRTRWTWGRRRPYILLGALPFGLSFAGSAWRHPSRSAARRSASTSACCCCSSSARPTSYTCRCSG